MAYKLTHSDSEQEIEVNAEDVHLYVAQGWKTRPGANVPTQATTANHQGVADD